MLHDLGLMIIEWSPSLVLSGRAIRPAYNSDDVQAYRDVLVFAHHEEVRCNRVDAQIANNKTKQVSCLGVNNSWEKKSKKKTVKYAPVRWELKQHHFPVYKLKQHNIIIDALEEWSREMDTTMYKIVGSRSKEMLKRMHKAVLSSMLNIARTFIWSCDLRDNWLYFSMISIKSSFGQVWIWLFL